MNDKTHEIESRTPVDTKGSERPLYVMMTIGKNNKRYWNGWVAEILSPEQKEELIKNKRATEEDLNLLTDNENKEIINALNERSTDNDIEWRRYKQSRIDALNDRSGNKLGDNAPQKKLLNFAGCQFPPICCDGFIFPMPVIFDKSRFTEHSSFRKATFLSSANFLQTEFAEQIDFSKAEFSQETEFSEAEFLRVTKFSEVEFLKSAYFTEAKFSSLIEFKKTEFHSLSVFANAKFESSTRFTEAVFKEKPPTFYGAALHEDTDWTGIKWPKVPKDDIGMAGDFRRAYECLKLIMAQQNKFPEEHFFQRLEFKCREAEALSSLKFVWSAVKSRNWKMVGVKVSLPALVSRFYGWISDYGWSIGRPLLGLTIIWLVGVLLIWPLGSEDVGFFQSMETSFNSIIPLPGLSAYSHEELKYLSTGLKIIYYSQTILGFVFLFLLGLGLRNRFRIK